MARQSQISLLLSLHSSAFTSRGEAPDEKEVGEETREAPPHATRTRTTTSTLRIDRLERIFSHHAPLAFLARPAPRRGRNQTHGTNHPRESPAGGRSLPRSMFFFFSSSAGDGEPRRAPLPRGRRDGSPRANCAVAVRGRGTAAAADARWRALGAAALDGHDPTEARVVFLPKNGDEAPRRV